MKKVLFVVALAMCSLCANAQKEYSSEVLDCLDKAMHISDLQSARSDLKRKALDCKNNTEMVLDFYKRLKNVDMRIANLVFELRKSVLAVSENEYSCDIMEFVYKILEDEDR